MSLETAPLASGPGRLTAHDVRQRLQHVRNARLVQLKTIEEAGHLPYDEVMAAQKTSIQRLLRDIDDAFDRLEHGSYGTCRECAEPIPDQRLEILPYTPCCVPCQRRAR